MAAKVRQIIETSEIAEQLIRAGCEILSRLGTPPDQIEAMIREVCAVAEVRLRAAKAVNFDHLSEPRGNTNTVREAIAQCTELQSYPLTQ